MGIQYLFIDAISIDQSLQGDELVKQVIAFSTLYGTIPVIAAYDKADELFRNTMHRPWISKEARLYRNNPTKIVYVGHTSQGGASLGKYFPKNELQDYRFGMELDSIWTGSFIETINGVLCGDIGMSYISDLKFIIAPCAQALVVAYEKMSRNDYLLTALILCANYTDTREIRLRSNTRENSFDRYSIRKVDGPGSGIFWAVYGIFLDGVRVGHLEAAGKTKSRVGSYVAVTPNSEDIILSSLGFKSSERKEYTANVQARHAYFSISNKSVPLPEIEVVSIEL
ncbi:hypothetical protein PFICI_09184 [Pestalotiopsis fici W106-1]|uniref:Uncharacterized protein n=1 Tax=Pestalotiopsis fici (strain W106-1 / CGMCC3.15140) TaxID=1229662 RepID=W3X2F2_PESFW|nr:uncharacterized protein PFICI_09184 [Pestalotiopsis fici W106-1]ETS79331.1 hypothetical protein PFICI_09184 [Pestalotiopsis fici W106-1]